MNSCCTLAVRREAAPTCVAPCFGPFIEERTMIESANPLRVARPAELESPATAAPTIIGPGAVQLELHINGQVHQVWLDPATTLVEVLRDQLGLTGTKIGCDRGACSACTVWADGELALSCMSLALDMRGKHITTIEGLAPAAELHAVQRAFIEHDALQCGFCTPGMVMACAWLIQRNPDCTLEDVKETISGHLCRCGAYPNIFKATLAAAQGCRADREPS
jgi:carbon-monoxide dehydrogenase small subunit/xanthine dehydrogenase YagT iron-sulfur-binding subunit